MANLAVAGWHVDHRTGDLHPIWWYPWCAGRRSHCGQFGAGVFRLHADGIRGAGAGVYSVAKIMESDGENLGLEASAEDLEKNWDKISDFSEAKPFFNGGEQTGKVLEKAMKGI